MKEVHLTRYGYTPTGTFGELEVDGKTWATVERPWADNKRNISCIPVGTYTIKLGTFYRNTPDPSDDYPVYEVIDVPGRSLIKIHIANTMWDVKGCIGLGKSFGFVKKSWAVIKSKDAYTEFMKAMEGEEKALLIVSNFEGGVLENVT